MVVVCVCVCTLTCAGVYRDTISPGIPPAHPWGGERIHVDAALMAPGGVKVSHSHLICLLVGGRQAVLGDVRPNAGPA